MQSPTSATAAAPLDLNDQSQASPNAGQIDARNGTDALNNHAMSNGDTGAGTAPSSEQGDAVSEGKEKAKAVMAAAGVNMDHAVDGPESRTSTPSNAPNGTILSRKRSRSGSRIPAAEPQTSESREQAQAEIKDYLIKSYVLRDQVHGAAMNDQAEESRHLFEAKQKEKEHYTQLMQRRRQDPTVMAGLIYGQGWHGFGNGKQDIGRMGVVVYPDEKMRLGKRRARMLHVSRKDTGNQAEQLEELVPIRLDIELDKLKLRDTFTWNLHDRVVTPDIFAQHLVEDFNVPEELRLTVIDKVRQDIMEQTQEFYPHVFIDEEPLDPHLPYSAYKNDEMRVLVKLNITIGQITLIDQFEWEINNPLNNPEEFARQMSRELSLSGEFTTAIAHSIREQTQMFTRSLYIIGHPFDGRTIEDADVRDGFLSSPLPSVFRPVQSAKEYAPYLYPLTEGDLQREELSILREQRRQKRSVTRRGGPALPDLKDRARTVRTMVVSSVIPGAAENIESSRLFKISQRSGRVRKSGARFGDSDDDDSESDDTGPDSPAAMQLGGTARQRTMRGAANAAQQAMRANLGRSATPDLSSLHHHETRTSARRFGVADTPGREGSDGPTSLIVKLKMPKEKYKRLVESLARRRTAAHGPPSQFSTPQMGNRGLPRGAQPSASPAPAASSTGTPTRVPQAGRVVEANGVRYEADGSSEAPHPQPAKPVRDFHPERMGNADI